MRQIAKILRSLALLLAAGMSLAGAAPQARAAREAPPDSGPSVTAWVDHPDNTYRTGDTLHLFAQVDRDAYLTVIEAATSGTIRILFPNRDQPDNHVRAGQTVMVPGSDAPFRLRVSGPAGSTVFKVIARGSPLPLFSPERLDNHGPFKTVIGGAAGNDRELEAALGTAPGFVSRYDKVVRVVDRSLVAPPPTVAMPAEGGFRLKLATDKTHYRLGEAVSITVTAERDCRLTVREVGPSGMTRSLVPHRALLDGWIRGGTPVRLPGETSPAGFPIGGPSGVTALVAICRVDVSPAEPSTRLRPGLFAAPGGVGSFAPGPSALIAHASASFLVSP